MVVRNGSEGSFNIFYKGLLISSFPLTKKKTVERYINQGEAMIRECKHIPIIKQIQIYKTMIDLIYNRKLNNQPIWREDHVSLLNCIMALIRLRVMENDEQNGYFAIGKKKSKNKYLDNNK